MKTQTGEQHKGWKPSRSSQEIQKQWKAARPGGEKTGRKVQHLRGITLAACLILSAFALDNSIWGPTLGPLSHLLRTPPTHIQLILELWSVGYIPGALLGGLLLDRFGPRRTFLAAALILFSGLLAFVVCLFFPYKVPLLVLLMLVCVANIGGGIIDSSTNGTMSSMYAHRRGVALNLFSLIYPLGGIIITLAAAGFLALFHNDPRPIFILSLCFAIVTFFSVLWIPQDFRIKHGTASLKQSVQNIPSLFVNFEILRAKFA
jgi:MFS family permease